jgi:hypothetical protein
MSPVYAELVTITPEQAKLEERTRENKREDRGGSVSSSAYSKVDCFFCGQRNSTNGLAQVNHKRKHVREGMLVELEYTGRGGYRPNSFIRPEHADSMLKTGYYRRVARLTNS